MVYSLVAALVLLFVGFLVFLGEKTVQANTTYFAISPSVPFVQDWSNGSLISANDDWTSVTSIMGYRGDDAAVVVGDVDPQTVLADYSAIPDVNANQSVPNTFVTAGVTEFAITNPVVALSGNGASDFPNIDIRLDTTGCPDPGNRLGLSYNVRDIDGSSDNAVQQVGLHYRIGSSGNYTNIPQGYIADATTGGLATLVTPVSILLPTAVQGQSQVHLRVLTSNAASNDEWVGIDDIAIICGAPTAAHVSLGGRITTSKGQGIGSVRVTLYRANAQEQRFAITNPFGYYRFPDLEAGGTVIVSVSSKRYSFSTPSRAIELYDELTDVDFIADPYY